MFFNLSRLMNCPKSSDNAPCLDDELRGLCEAVWSDIGDFAQDVIGLPITISTVCTLTHKHAMNQGRCWLAYFMHLISIKVLALLGAVLIGEMYLDSKVSLLVKAEQGLQGLQQFERSTGAASESEKHCPDGPPTYHKHIWESHLDVASKAYLAPIVFNGKLTSISEDYGGRIGVTFRIQKMIKNSSSLSLSSHLRGGQQVTLYFVRNKLKSEPPFCAIFINDNVLKLRPGEKYFVFASPPMTTFSSVNSANNANTHHFTRAPHSYTVISLSAFAPPEPFSKRSSRLIRKLLCKRCGKFISSFNDGRPAIVRKSEKKQPRDASTFHSSRNLKVTITKPLWGA